MSSRVIIAVLAVLLLVLAATIGAVSARAYLYCDRFMCASFPNASIVDTPLAAGDILLFVGAAHMFYNSIFTQDLYTHIGMVVEDPADGGLWLSESTRGIIYRRLMGGGKAGVKKHGKTMLTPLYQRLYMYPGEAMVVKLTPALPPALKLKLWECAQRVTPYPSLPYLAAGLAGAERALFSREQRHCMAHVGWLVDELGLRPEKDPCRLQDRGIIEVCRAVAALHERGPSASGHQYAPPVHLLYDAELVSWDGQKWRDAQLARDAQPSRDERASAAAGQT